LAHFLPLIRQAFTKSKTKLKMKSQYENISSKKFNEIIKNDLIIVECGNDCCGRCHLMNSIVEPIIKKSEKKIQFIRIDIETSTEIKKEYSIYKKPTYLVFKKGIMIDKIEKLISQNDFLLRITIYTNGYKHNKQREV
jgi:thiol-disulfide isomerase/thioredoxin